MLIQCHVERRVIFAELRFNRKFSNYLWGGVWMIEKIEKEEGKAESGKGMDRRKRK